MNLQLQTSYFLILTFAIFGGSADSILGEHESSQDKYVFHQDQGFTNVPSSISHGSKQGNSYALSDTLKKALFAINADQKSESVANEDKFSATYSFTVQLLERLRGVDLKGLEAGTGSLCSNHTSYVLDALTHLQPWAFPFVDALGKPASGILEGALTWPGSFSQCRNISAMMPVTGGNSLFSGRYCWMVVQNGIALPGIPKGALTVNFGMCVPDSCQTLEAAYILSYLLNKAKLWPTINITSAYCKRTQAEQPDLDTPAICVITLLCVLAAIIKLATFYDYFFNSDAKDDQLSNSLLSDVEPVSQDLSDNDASLPATESPPLLGGREQTNAVIIRDGQRKPLGVRLLLCFSLLTNGAKLLSTKPTNQKNLAAIHGIRFISMSWVILGHTFAFLLNYISNKTTIATYFTRYSFEAIVGASVSVDTFFLLSGVLAGYLLYGRIKEAAGPRNINWALVYFHRFWRLTPPYMLVIAIWTTLYHYMGYGPFFTDTADKNCQDNWWYNLLYINNFVSEAKQCIGWTWYLANDMQFFLITPLVVVLLYKWAVVGMILIGSLLLMNMITTGVLTKVNGYPADFASYVDVDLVKNPNILNDYFNQVYQRPYTRIGPYAVGLILAYILVKTDLKPRLPKILVVLGWLVATVCCYEVVYGLYPVASQEIVLSPTVNAFYASVHRIVWAIGVSWVIFACVTGYGGPVNTFLSWTAFIPLSRLTYMAYLIHPIVMFYVYTTLQKTVYISDISMAYIFIANMAVSYAVAFVTSLAFEAPMMALEKIVFPQK